MINDGLNDDEINRLHQLHLTCKNLCASLSNECLPETINHGDFHENNMLLEAKSHSINIIDWGETVITHPFLSLNSFLWNITYFNDLNQSDKAYQLLQTYCISFWRDWFDEEKLRGLFHIANRLSGVFAALNYDRLYNATKLQTKPVSKTHHGSIAGCLKTFIKQNSLS